VQYEQSASFAYKVNCEAREDTLEYKVNSFCVEGQSRKEYDMIFTARLGLLPQPHFSPEKWGWILNRNCTGYRYFFKRTGIPYMASVHCLKAKLRRKSCGMPEVIPHSCEVISITSHTKTMICIDILDSERLQNAGLFLSFLTSILLVVVKKNVF
jgi:hypothetical protein